MNGIIEPLERRRLLAITGLPIKIGADNFDMARSIVATDDGGYVVAGLFAETVDFDYGPAVVNLTSSGDTDIYVARYDSASQLVWVKQFGSDRFEDGIRDQDEFIDIAANPARGGGSFINGWGDQPAKAGEYINDLIVGPDDSVIVAGSFTGSVDFNPGAGKRVFKTFDNDFFDTFILKLNSGGGLVWAQQFGDRFTDVPGGIAQDASQNIFVTGVFSRDVNFVPGDPDFLLHARGRADAYLMKLDPQGQVLWIHQFGGDAVDPPVREAGNDVAVDSQGSAYVVGTFVGDEVDFDPSPTKTAILQNYDRTDGFLAKYDANGKFKYAASFGGDDYDGIVSVAVDSTDSVIFAGYFEGERVDVEPGSATRFLNATPKDPGDDPDFTDIFVEKLSRGRVAWVRQLAGTGTEFIDDIKVDSGDQVLLAGSFYGTATFGASTTLTSVRGDDDFEDPNDNDRDFSYDAFVWKMTATGGNRFVRTYGAASDDFGAGVTLTAAAETLFAGRFRKLVDFDFTAGVSRLNGFGLADSFVTGFDENGALLS